jgi:DNA repair exonuclease SbcCD ATPase subunit
MENNCPNHKDTKSQIERIENDLRLVVQEIAVIKQGAVSMEASTKASHKRLDEVFIKVEHLEQRSEEILRLALSIERLAESIKSHNDSIDEHEDRLRTMEESAGKYALKMWQIVAGLMLTGAVGFLLSHFGIGG